MCNTLCIKPAKAELELNVMCVLLYHVTDTMAKLPRNFRANTLFSKYFITPERPDIFSVELRDHAQTAHYNLYKTFFIDDLSL